MLSPLPSAALSAFDVGVGIPIAAAATVAADVVGSLLDPARTLGGVPAVVTPGKSSDVEWLSGLVRSATGWGGLGIVFAYSVLIAFAFPGVSEIVLFAPLNLGLPDWLRLSLIIAVSAFGKAIGSLLAFHIGQSAKNAGPVVRVLDQVGFDVVGWSRRRTVQLVQRWGYAGLAVGLSVPGFPDTISIYAFSALEEDYFRFAVATFVGSVNRLLVTLLGIHTFATVF